VAVISGKNPIDSSALLPEWGRFGCLISDGFRITRWDGGEAWSGRNWFDSQALVLCLNVTGSGKFHSGGRASCVVEPGSVILSAAPRERQHLERGVGMSHRFVVLEMRRPWLRRWLPSVPDELQAPVNRFLKPGRRREAACESRPMTAQLSQLAADVLQPPRANAGITRRPWRWSPMRWSRAERRIFFASARNAWLASALCACRRF
jgi:hypothetical protein